RRPADKIEIDTTKRFTVHILQKQKVVILVETNQWRKSLVQARLPSMQENPHPDLNAVQITLQ
ncbi:MAG: hypothetical protein ACYSR6_12595, partial [Planctomycetota bacterium]